MAEDRDPRLVKFEQWYGKSKNQRTDYEARWTRNMKLVDGIFGQEETTTKSKVRNRSKIFFRKIWAIVWRLMASFYAAFLRDQDTFKIQGRGYGELGNPAEDAHKSRVLHFMTEYRRDYMNNKDALFKKHIWAFQDIANMGWCVGKMTWLENDYYKGPKYILYPPEQVFPDWAGLESGNIEDMGYIMFENYLTKDQMENLGYDNIEKAQSSSIPSNQVRQTRFFGLLDPLQNPGENEYPKPGSYYEGRKDTIAGAKYRCIEHLWREDGRIMYAVTNNFDIWLKKPEENPEGNCYNVAMGECLLKAHSPIGEGFPEPLAGPQESINYTLNQRKDNIALTLNRHTFVSRWGGVDMQSLVDSRPGGITVMDDINAVKEREMPDVTQSAFVEAAADDAMMQEMGGITQGKLGRETAEKATVAQINMMESNAKIDLYIAIVAETYMKRFFYLLAKLIQRFETDETVYRVANDRFRQEAGIPAYDVYDIEDMDIDCIISVGAGTVGRDMEIKNTLLAMDRAVMANQSLIQLLSSGAQVGEVRLFNTTRFMEDLLPMLGKRNAQEYFFNAGPAPQQKSLSQQMGELQGGKTEMPNKQNMIQAGSFGGI